MTSGHRLASAVALALLVSVESPAQVAPEPDGPLAALAFVDPRLRPEAAGSPFAGAADGLAPEVRDGWNEFTAAAGGPWKAWVDRRTGRVDFAEGAGIPWVPGAGNTLPPPAAGRVDLDHLERKARAFLPRVAVLLGVDPASLVLAPGRSGQPAGHLWLVDFDVELEGLKVEAARVVFRINNGNLIQLGSEHLPAPGAEVPPEKVDRKQALGIVADYVGGFTAADSFADGGTARLLPVGPGRGGVDGERGLARVWEVTFRRRGSDGTWRARVDATTGEILEFRDVNAYAEVTGGAYPVSWVFADETVLPMPYADLSSGGFADAAGQYPLAGPVSSSLNGRYVKIQDSCGLISQSSGALGHIAFGSSSGTDCTTPGSGGAGNTHAARTQFYHVNRIKEMGRGWLPGNSWLEGQLQTNVNLGSTCNAFWNGSSINFYRSGGGCGNTGEIAAISLHEYAHGLDWNDGAGFSNDRGSGEAYADLTAALMLRDSCMGDGFRTTHCGGYGDPCTACTGVRDIDWARHASNTPHTVESFTRQACYSSSYSGPCGRQGHCESHVASEAVWDLAARDLPDAGGNGAFLVAERLWYLSRPTATAAFTCNTSAIPWTSNGCSAGSWWRTMRAVDDDDGDLSNGTPHSCHLFAAFDRHGIACADDAAADVCFSGCTPPEAPGVALAAGNRQVELSWTAAAGAAYDVFRSEMGCGAGFVRAASGLTGSAFTDTGVANGRAYSYVVVAHAEGNGACAAAPTACQSATPVEPPCDSPPPAPGGLSADAQGIDRIALSWDAVAGALEYRIFRALSAGGPWTLVAAVPASSTGYLDKKLEPGTEYFYKVRAATGDTCESADSGTASAATVHCEPQTLYAEGFESSSGLADWTVEALNGTGSALGWRGVQACAAHQGANVFRFGGETCGGYYPLEQHGAARPRGEAGFAIPEGAGLTRLSFWHRHVFEQGYDGGTLQLSLDGGAYAQVPGSALSGKPYNGSLFAYCAPPGTTGTPIFTGGTGSGYSQTVVDLDAACEAAGGGSQGCGGRTLRVGFKTMTDCFGGLSYTGWFLDDVAVTTCVPRGCTGAPELAAAASPADHQVLLTWSQGTPASTSFNVYRALGTCASPGAFTRVASGVAGTSWLDGPVSGGTSWAYRVAGLDETGVCESDLAARRCGCAGTPARIRAWPLPAGT